MFQVVALILERVEGFIFHLPPGTTTAHDLIDIVLGEGKVRNPAKGLVSAILTLPVLQDVDEHVFVGLIKRQSIGKTEEMAHSLSFWVHHRVLDRLPVCHGLIQASREVLVVVVFEAEDEVATAGLKVPDVGSVGAESILGDDGFQMRMVFSKLLQPPPARIALAVVLGLPVLFADELGRQRDHLLAVRMDHSCPQRLEMIDCFAGFRAFLFQAGRGFKFRGREIAGPINGNEVAVFHEDHLLKHLASLSVSEHCFVGRTDGVGVDLIEPLAHLGIAGEFLDVIDGSQVVFLGHSSALELEQGRVFQGKHGVC